MPKQTLKEKEEYKQKLERYSKGYKDYWYLLLLTVVVWILESPAVAGLLMSDSRSHFHS